MEARSLCQRDHTKLVVLVLTNSEGLPENHTLLRSAAKHGYVLTFMFLNRTDPVEMESPYNAKLPKAITVLRTEPCANTVFMMIDAFDCFFVRPASDTLRRFYEMRRGVVWSAQAGFSYSQGIESTIFDMKARIPLRDVSRFPLHRVDCALRVPTHRTQCPSSERLHKHRFLNAGGVIGFRDALLRMFLEAVSVRPGGEAWRDRTRSNCGEAHGRSCAEQWAAQRVLAFMPWEVLNVTLDYESRIFLAAEWSLSQIKQQMMISNPSVVHVPFIKAPRVSETLKALLADVVDGAPWIESDLPACRKLDELCMEREDTLAKFSRAVLVCRLNLTHLTEWSALQAVVCPTFQESRRSTCRRKYWPPQNELECLALDKALKRHSPVDPCGDSYQPLIVRSLCRRHVSNAFWRVITQRYVARDEGLREFRRVGLGDEMPRSMGTYWEAYPRCYYGEAHRPGKTKVSC